MAQRAPNAKRPSRQAPADDRPLQAGLLESLGIFGWEGVEPVLVAAIATEEPVLLIGPHGTAKSLLLNRLAEALGLRHRHYNASLLNFDDLAGYPVPTEDRTRLVYVPTAGSVWDAESVLFDEISRCRVDLQNKLFPIIHERVIQGLALPRLRHRWAAMNPPAPPDAEEEDDEATDLYRGSEALDPALADRFPFVIEAPDFGAMTEAARRAVISGASSRTGPDGAPRLRAAIETTQGCLAAIREELCGAICDYVAALLPLLEKMRRKASPRRAGLASVARHVRFLPRPRLSCAIQASFRSASGKRTRALSTWISRIRPYGPELTTREAPIESVRPARGRGNDPSRRPPVGAPP